MRSSQQPIEATANSAVSLAAAVLAVLEVAYIMVQAGRARASHFNNAMPLEEVAYALRG
jgi:hypothetical protein